MILKKLSEAKVKDKYADLISEIKQKDSKLNELRDTTIANIIQVFKKDTKDSKEELTADNIVSWFNESETFGEFVFFYADDIFTYSISDFAEHEDKLANAIRAVLKSCNIIDDEDHDLSLIATYHNDPEKVPERTHKMTIQEMCEFLFNKKDQDFESNVAEVEEAYNKLTESVIDELKPEKEKTEEVTEEPTEETEVKEVETIESPVDVPETVFSDMINSAIQKEWEIISHFNSLIATFDYDYKEANKDDILAVLNQLVDDSTINVGMLHKVSELVSSKSSELVSTGQEKAEEIISAE